MAVSDSAISYIPSTADIERYRHLRRLAAQLNDRIVKTIPREAMHEVGQAIGIFHQGTLIFETEDETSVLMDCCLYDWLRDGKNLVEQYAENHHSLPGTEEHELLQAFLRAKYRIVVPQERVPGAGVHVVDLFSAEQLFIMDFGLSQTPFDVAYATRTIPLGPFWMTGGAGLPTGSDGMKEILASLREEGLLQDGKFTDRQRAALTIIRVLLAEGAAQHVEYQDPLPLEVGNARRGATHRSNRPINIPGRNSPCPCGSGKRYKRCCGGAE